MINYALKMNIEIEFILIMFYTGALNLEVKHY